MSAQCTAGQKETVIEDQYQQLHDQSINFAVTAPMKKILQFQYMHTVNSAHLHSIHLAKPADP